MEILEAAGDVHRPGRVAEVSAQLAGHGRSGERGEWHAELGVEALDRFEDPESSDLDEVVDRLAATAEPHRLTARRDRGAPRPGDCGSPGHRFGGTRGRGRDPPSAQVPWVNDRENERPDPIEGELVLRAGNVEDLPNERDLLVVGPDIGDAIGSG